MTQNELEARIQTLEDVEAIKKLQNAYCFYLQHWQAEELIGLFSESPDAPVEIGEGGQWKGKEGIRKYFNYQDHFATQSSSPPPELLQQLMALTAIVDVDPGGKTAKGRWYGFGCSSVPTESKVQALFGSGIWENEFVKEGGKWKFKKLHYSSTFSTPYEDGWVKTPVWKGRPARKDHPASSPEHVAAQYPSSYIFPYHYKNPVTGK